MLTDQLRVKIVDVLFASANPLRAYDIAAAIEPKVSGSNARRVALICKALHGHGYIAAAPDVSKNGDRYMFIKPAYEWLLNVETGKYLVLRGLICVGKDMTEAEARCCVTALNELDRKARAFKRGGK